MTDTSLGFYPKLVFFFANKEYFSKSYPQFEWGMGIVLWDKVVYNTSKWDEVVN